MDIYGVISLTDHLVNNIIQGLIVTVSMAVRFSHEYPTCLGRSSPRRESYDTQRNELPKDNNRPALPSLPQPMPNSKAYKYNPSGSPSLLVFRTLSLALLKSAICTLILLSLKASKPASVQIALISAPDRSSFWLINSSSSTSPLRDIFDVWRVKILRLVFSVIDNVS